MSKLKFNDMSKILEWIKEPSHFGYLDILEQAIKSTKAEQFKVGTKVSFGRPNGMKRMGMTHGGAHAANPAPAQPTYGDTVETAMNKAGPN